MLQAWWIHFDKIKHSKPCRNAKNANSSKLNPNLTPPKSKPSFDVFAFFAFFDWFLKGLVRLLRVFSTKWRGSGKQIHWFVLEFPRLWQGCTWCLKDFVKNLIDFCKISYWFGRASIDFWWIWLGFDGLLKDLARSLIDFAKIW